MPQVKRKRPKGEVSREHIFGTALDLFRTQGFRQTSMRDIAEAARMSPGAAYHYFPSKDSLVLAYYEWMQATHEGRAAQGMAEASTVGEKLGVILGEKIDLLAGDRKLLVALFSTLGDPDHPLSFFGAATTPVRERSVAQFRAVFASASIPDELMHVLGYGAWLMHLGVFFYFIHDDSPGQERTKKLARAVSDFFDYLTPLARNPVTRPVVRRALKLAHELGLPR